MQYFPDLIFDKLVELSNAYVLAFRSNTNTYTSVSIICYFKINYIES